MLRGCSLSLLLHATCALNGVYVNYFAYGSNLASSVLRGRRGVLPRATNVGLVPDYRLAFSLPGVPPEPAFASIEPAEGDSCHGAVYTLTLGDWAKVCASEGVPFGYRVEQVDVQCYDGRVARAWTLRAAAPREASLPPSRRYLDLIKEGAKELGLAESWQLKLDRLQGYGEPSQGPRAPGAEYENRPDARFV